MLMEINRVSSHWVWLATGGMELGALTAMTNGFRARERCLDIFELITGLRMNHAYIRPGGVAQDLPEGTDEKVREAGQETRKELHGVDKLLRGQPIWVNRLKDVGWIGVEGCLALGVTGPLLRAAGLPWDLRKTDALPRLRDVRLRGADRRSRRLLVAVRRAGRRDARVAEDRRAGARPARARTER